MVRKASEDPSGGKAADRDIRKEKRNKNQRTSLFSGPRVKNTPPSPMARWFYNRPSENCDASEIKVANKLRQLSKRWTIRWGFYYTDNKGTRREGDFLIFDPIHGLLVLEVKGDRLRQFAPTGRWEGHPEKDRDHPLFQLDQEYAGVLKTLAETEPS